MAESAWKYMLLGIGLIGICSIGRAATQVEGRYSRDYNLCMAVGDAANGVTSGILDCSGAEIDRQDARLNEAYKMVMMRLNPRQRIALRALERQWIVGRDTHCHQAAAVEEGGTLAAVIYSNCFLDETIKRTIWLEAYKG